MRVEYLKDGSIIEHTARQGAVTHRPHWAAVVRRGIEEHEEMAARDWWPWVSLQDCVWACNDLRTADTVANIGPGRLIDGNLATQRGMGWSVWLAGAVEMAPGLVRR